jgi:hypothetical protein
VEVGLTIGVAVSAVERFHITAKKSRAPRTSRRMFATFRGGFISTEKLAGLIAEILQETRKCICAKNCRSTFFEIGLVFVRLDHLARFIKISMVPAREESF